MELEMKEIKIRIGRLSDEQIRGIFAKFNAVLGGHFVLASRGMDDELKKKKFSFVGDHSGKYADKAILYIPPDALLQLSGDIAFRFANETPPVDVVAGILAGTICPAWLVKQCLYWITGREVKSVFIEGGKEKVIKRGYGNVVSGKNVLFVEDITTTGESLKNAIDVVKEAGGNVIGAAIMCNRSGGKANAESLGVPRLENQLELSAEDLKKYLLEDCPLCKKGVPITPTPGHGAEFLENQEIIKEFLQK